MKTTSTISTAGIVVLAMLLLVLGSIPALAQEEGSNTESRQAEAIITAKTPCGQLSEEQLELVGDYYMEKMHPGEAHELMEQMMGGEGSAQLKQMHIAMAKRLYCGEQANAYSMGMMGGMMGTGTGFGMMGSRAGSEGKNQWNGGGMMGGYGGYWALHWLWTILFTVAAILLVMWLWKQVRKTPLDAIKERYARGEVSRKDFEEMKKGMR